MYLILLYVQYIEFVLTIESVFGRFASCTVCYCKKKKSLHPIIFSHYFTQNQVV